MSSKIKGISEQLAEQAKKRFETTELSNQELENNKLMQDDSKIIKDKFRQENKTQKTYYIKNDIVEAMRKMAYENKLDNTRIVNMALEKYLSENGYDV
jgi:hypothetical protein